MKNWLWFSLVSFGSMFIGCNVQSPPPKPATPSTLNVTRFLWSDSKDLPQNISQENHERGRFGLMAQVQVQNSQILGAFLEQADSRVLMEPEEGFPTLKMNFDSGCWWFQDGSAWIYVPFGPADRRDLKTNLLYRVRPQNNATESLWNFDQNLKRTPPPI
jgi:hypothetical protein